MPWFGAILTLLGLWCLLVAATDMNLAVRGTAAPYDKTPVAWTGAVLVALGIVATVLTFRGRAREREREARRSAAKRVQQPTAVPAPSAPPEAEPTSPPLRGTGTAWTVDDVLLAASLCALLLVPFGIVVGENFGSPIAGGAAPLALAPVVWAVAARRVRRCEDADVRPSGRLAWAHGFSRGTTCYLAALPIVAWIVPLSGAPLFAVFLEMLLGAAILRAYLWVRDRVAPSVLVADGREPRPRGRRRR